jgi:hypothetical protein
MGMAQFNRWGMRPLAMVAVWSMATGFFGIAYYQSGGKRSRVEDACTFTAAFAVAAAMSAVVTLVVQCKRRWAMEAAVPMTITLAAPVIVAWSVSLLMPVVGRAPRRVSYLPRFGGQPTTAILEIAKQTVLTGVIVGVAIGLIAGLLILLARRMPRPVRWLVVGLLLASVSNSVHIVAFDQVSDLVLKARLGGMNRLTYSWTIQSELPAAIGATAGAFVGAVAACGAVRLRRRPATFRASGDS